MKKLKEISNASLSDTEEAIISKKPLQINQMCASCNKELPNLSSESNGFSVWDRFPIKDYITKPKNKKEKDKDNRLSMSNDDSNNKFPTLK